MTKLEMDFYEALKGSIDCSEGDFDRNKKRPYYTKEYLDEMKRLFEVRGIKSVQKRYLNALASSARLAFHDYCDKKEVEFEKPVSNDLKVPRGSTEIDVSIGKKYYECKCQEILKHHRIVLEKRYSEESSLFKEFDCSYTPYNGAIQIDAESLGIKIPIDHSPDKWRFEIKQLLCHLIAIAEERKELKLNRNSPTTLKYVFYKPLDVMIERFGKVDQAYNCLKDEIQSIWKSPTINSYTKTHGIVLDYTFRDVSEITDKVHKKIYG